MNENDKRCIKTREATERSLFYFYTEHQLFERLPIVTLCRTARISTPTFYRHYGSLLDVVESRHQKINAELSDIFAKNVMLIIALVRTFQFINKHRLYYKAAIRQRNYWPFEEILVMLMPFISDYVRKKYGNAAKWLDEKFYYDIENYIVAEIKWWGQADNFDESKIEERIGSILSSIKYRVRVH